MERVVIVCICWTIVAWFYANDCLLDTSYALKKIIRGGKMRIYSIEDGFSQQIINLVRTDLMMSEITKYIPIGRSLRKTKNIMYINNFGCHEVTEDDITCLICSYQTATGSTHWRIKFITCEPDIKLISEIQLSGSYHKWELGEISISD